MHTLPLPYGEPSLPVLRGEVRQRAIAAAGGVLAGAATVAAVRAVSAAGSQNAPRAASAAAAIAPTSSPAAPSWSTSTCSGASAAGSRPASLDGARARGRPPSPYRLARGSEDRTLRVRGGVATRLLHVEGSPVLVRAWQPGAGASSCARRRSTPRLGYAAAGRRWAPTPAGAAAAAGGRADALRVRGRRRPGEFHRRFRRDPLLGPLIRRMPGLPAAAPALAVGGARLRRWSSS